MSHVRKICICSICIALCYVLPLALHPLGLGQVLSPMHIPVLLCGLLCGPVLGAICGIAGPILSATLGGMPPVTALPTMIPELVTYGIFAGILIKAIRTKSTFTNVFLALIPTMLLGRVIGALAKAVFYFIGVFGVTSFSLKSVAAAYFVGTLPGIIVHLLLIPLLVTTLKEEKLIKLR